VVTLARCPLSAAYTDTGDFQFAFSFVNLVLIRSFRVVRLTCAGSCIQFVSLVLIQFAFSSILDLLVVCQK